MAQRNWPLATDHGRAREGWRRPRMVQDDADTSEERAHAAASANESGGSDARNATPTAYASATSR